MNDEFVGRFMAFKGDDEYVEQKNVLLEITELAEGAVEIAFNAPLPGNPRIYICIPFAELCDRLAKWGDEK